MSHGKTTKNQLHFLCEFFSQTLHNLVDLTFTIRLQQRRKGKPALEPSERRRKIIVIISIRRYDTMRNLACEFGVSWQTIFRDMQVLAGEYPLIITRGNGGGVALPKGYYVSRRYLTLKQEDAIRRNLDVVNREDRAKREQNAVLFAAGSCWEGIDFPGDMVSSLIIPRLPFPVPDPIREAQRPNYMTLQDYIQAVIVPEMQVKLRQGFGRAIRTETDTCVVSILDHRAAPGGKYHREVTEALPSVPVTRQIEDVERFIRARKGLDYFFVQRREAMCLKTEKCARCGSTVAAEARA